MADRIEGRRERTARLTAAAETAVAKARAEGISPFEAMRELTGESAAVCHGYLMSRPDALEVQQLAQAVKERAEEALIKAAAEAGPVVRVRRQWNDYRLAAYPLSEVEGLHWSDISGGIQATAPRSFVHGYVWCDRMIAGELAHSCAHGRGPHRIKVCITKKHNETVFPLVLETLAHGR